MLCQKLQSEFCYLAPFRRRIDFRGVDAAGNWNQNYCSGHLKRRHLKLAQSPLWKHAEKNGGRNWSPGTTHEILKHLYQTNESFLINKRTYANIATNLNSKIVLFHEYLNFHYSRLLTIGHDSLITYPWWWWCPAPLPLWQETEFGHYELCESGW